PAQPRTDAGGCAMDRRLSSRLGSGFRSSAHVDRATGRADVSTEGEAMSRRVSTATRDEPIVRIEEAFSSPRERVFDAWINPHLLEQWFAPSGCTLHIVRIDVRPGGGYHWCIKNPAFGPCWSIGTYVEVVRPERLVFTSVVANAEGIPS